MPRSIFTKFTRARRRRRQTSCCCPWGQAGGKLGFCARVPDPVYLRLGDPGLFSGKKISNKSSVKLPNRLDPLLSRLYAKKEMLTRAFTIVVDPHLFQCGQIQGAKPKRIHADSNSNLGHKKLNF
jgi:hypothetical protein